MAEVLEVRCCCQPTKLLGFVMVDDWTFSHARFLRRIRRPSIPSCSLREAMDTPVTFTSAVVELPIEIYASRHSIPYRCVKAEGLDVPELQALLGDNFIPAR